MRYRSIALALVILSASVSYGQTLAERLRPLISAHEGEIAVAVKHLKTGESFAHRADEPLPTASLIKLPIMVEAYRQAAAGQLSLTDTVTFRDEDKTPGSGILSTHFSAGATFSLRDAVRLMIAYSDNAATNLVLAKIGLSATNDTMVKLGLPNTKVHAFVFRPNSSLAPERSKEFGLGSTTANEMIKLLDLINSKQIVTPQACDAILEHLRNCQDKRLSRLLPAGVKVAHKTGSVAAVRTDAGLIEAKRGPIAISVLTRNNKDQRWTEDNAAEALTSKIARAVYDYFEGEQAAANDLPQDLKSGSTGQLVQAVQRTLNGRLKPSPELTVDGDFGPITEAAVMAFQRSQGLAATGVVNSATLRALAPLLAGDAQPLPAQAESQTLSKEPPESLTAPPLTTCQAWAIADGKTGALLIGSHETEKLDMASTTKIMTAYIVCQLAKDNPKVLDEQLTFSEKADKTIGTTSDVHAGEKVPVGELLYGLLLPSGNDAATAFAEHFAGRVGAAQQNPLPRGEGGPAPAGPGEGQPTRPFIDEMNRQAALLGLEETHYENPHGLTAKGHHTSARDLTRLAFFAMQNPLFRRCVGTREHSAKAFGQDGQERSLVWKNTNRLLSIEGYLGVKTGTTDAAGACLVSYGQRDGRELIVAVLGSSPGTGRYVDTRNLFRWAWQQK